MLLLPKTLEFSKTIKKLHKKLKLSQRLEIPKPRSSGKVEMAKKGKNQQLSTRAGGMGDYKKYQFLNTFYKLFCIKKSMHSKRYAFKKICIQKGMHSKRYAFRKVCIQKVCIQKSMHSKSMHSKCMH